MIEQTPALAEQLEATPPEMSEASPSLEAPPVESSIDCEGKLLLVITESSTVVRCRERSDRKVSRLLRSEGLPCLPGSSVTGSLRARVQTARAEQPTNEFSWTMSDAQLLFFPVRVPVGGVVWLTSPSRLENFAAVHPALAEFRRDWQQELSSPVAASDPSLVVYNSIIFEEMYFPATVSQALANAMGRCASSIFPQSDDYRYLQSFFPKHVALCADDLFKTLTHVASPTVTSFSADGSEEARHFWREVLPSDSIFFSRVESGDGTLLLAELREKRIARVQIGADETRGRGICAVNIL